MNVRKSVFSLDIGDAPDFEGYTTGQTWNGFACPLFDFETAKKVLDDFVENMRETQPDFAQSFYWTYDEATNTFEAFIDLDSDETTVYAGITVLYEDKPLQVYPIAEFYCWMEVTEQEPTEDPQQSDAVADWRDEDVF